MTSSKRILDETWILCDNRPGTASQGLGLAQELGFEYKIIDLNYGSFAALPNCIFQNSLIRLSKISRYDLQEISKNFTHFPKLIISSGRRSASVALYLKKRSKNQTKIIQIMNPNLCFSKFDFVILPKHDGFEESKYTNLITTIGALTKINDKKIEEEKIKFRSWFESIEKKKIAVLVGGNGKNTKFTTESTAKLAKLLSHIAKKMDAMIFILTSKRTSEEISSEIKSNLKCDFKFFDWENYKTENPYIAILGYADFFVITGDSVSMISESCYTGKPVYIFEEKQIASLKHKKFHHNLFEESYAKKLTQNIKELENSGFKKLHETRRVADIIRHKLCEE